MTRLNAFLLRFSLCYAMFYNHRNNFFTFLCTFICLLIHDYVLLHHSK